MRDFYGEPLTRREVRRQGLSNRRRRHPVLRLVRLLLLLVLVYLVLQVAVNPWIFRIGGKLTPSMSWQGVGVVTASNGGHYVLYTRFNGGFLAGTGNPACSQFGCDNLKGSARLCTANGSRYTFALAGKVKAWLDTDGSKTSLDLTGGSPKALPDGWVVALHGTWRGESLVLASPDNSFTEAFTPRGVIRTVTSTADAGTAEVTLQPGTLAAFDRACSGL
ncbi:MAG TPA: hypothetical protein VNF47_07415 [Streptosporangiaceae bacterium]|nr:hypothetical protein [Streptosporangiaceae bacterium]